MRLHSIHHVAYEGLGAIADWAHANLHRHTATWQHLGDELPDPDEIDLLVVMGGPMGVNEEEQHPWMRLEKAFVAEVIQRNIPTLGICLGAQLIAQICGATVAPNREKEIGWFPVSRTESTQPWLDGFPDPLTVLHWHGDRFEIPEGAIRLWESSACDNQGFALGSALGLQFHLEMMPADVLSLCHASENERNTGGEHVQSAKELQGTSEHFTPCREALFTLLDHWSTPPTLLGGSMDTPREWRRKIG